MLSKTASLLLILLVALSAQISLTASAQYYYPSSPTPPAITSPNPPTSLMAKVISSTEIDLSWNSPANNGGSQITSYKIYELVNSNKQAIDSTSSTSYQITNLSPGTTYTFYVSAVNSAGESQLSTSVSATTQVVRSPAPSTQPLPPSTNQSQAGSTPVRNLTTTMNETVQINETANKAVPEFGPVSALILTTSIVSMILISMRTRNFKLV